MSRKDVLANNANLESKKQALEQNCPNKNTKQLALPILQELTILIFKIFSKI